VVGHEHLRDLLGLRHLCEGGEAAQIKKDHADLAPVRAERIGGADALLTPQTRRRRVVARRS
jgi:hypothetical protein